MIALPPTGSYSINDSSRLDSEKRLCHTSNPRWLDSTPAAEESRAIFWHGSGSVKTALKSIRVYGWEGKDLVTGCWEACPSHIKTDPEGNIASEASKTPWSYAGAMQTFPLGKESESSNVTWCWEFLQDAHKQQSVVKASLTDMPETYVYWIKSHASEQQFQQLQSCPVSLCWHQQLML